MLKIALLQLYTNLKKVQSDLRVKILKKFYYVLYDIKIAKKSKYKKIEYGFAIIHIKNPKEIEETPGVTAFLLSNLASENINIYHIMDCREDTFLVIKEYEAPLAFKTLAESLKIS